MSELNGYVLMYKQKPLSANGKMQITLHSDMLNYKVHKIHTFLLKKLRISIIK